MRSSHDPTTQTLGYYDQNAKAFADSTADVEFSATQDAFASLLDSGASVLDLGCGSGRDAKRFKELGFAVTATDGCAEMARIASAYAGIPVRHELFSELEDVEAYDGVWACSSILHVPKRDLPDVLARIARALKPSGVLYTSFKLGEFEGLRNGRYFSDFTLPAFEGLLESVPDLGIEKSWESADVRPGRSDERWLNLLLRKS